MAGVPVKTEMAGTPRPFGLCVEDWRSPLHLRQSSVVFLARRGGRNLLPFRVTYYPSEKTFDPSE